MAHRVWAKLISRRRPLRPDRTWLLAVLALLTFVGPLWTNLMLWSVEYLGYDIDPRSGQVTRVVAGGAAAEAGIQPGDQLQSLYGRPWTTLLYRWDHWRVVAQSPTQVPVTVERAGELLSFKLPRRSPEPSYQIAKIVFALLGAACWITGVLLGLGRRHEVN